MAGGDRHLGLGRDVSFEPVDGESEDDAEERRLFYVAVTRAKDELVLCAPEMRRTRDGGVFFCKPSRFIKELPRGLTRESYGFRGGY